ncbi:MULTISPECIES: RepB family protein [unclassified Pantoea]|jgi:hypothetical protein|uniref:RepB family protein n=1 Tax=unclassified Pantoea TaxID=2630326 RepID=UPI00177BC586|nr:MULTISPECIES: RepB family protein [unclassified Pantoea]MBD9646402.1 replication protein [Pantoea sp. PNT02]MEA5105712.1 RepB family protein [Pantoea sp. S18]
MAARDSVTSPPAKKNSRDRKNPASDKERTQAYQARMRETHKVLRVYLENEVKNALVGLCQDEGISQSELLERLIREELVRKRNL